MIKIEEERFINLVFLEKILIEEAKKEFAKLPKPFDLSISIDFIENNSLLNKLTYWDESKKVFKYRYGLSFNDLSDYYEQNERKR